jgi:GNAT superfamily N-acetyltransferase
MALAPGQMPLVEAVAEQSHPPQLYESNECFLHKMALFPAGALGFFDGGTLAGYAFSHPWATHFPAPINEIIEMPPFPDCLYVHDIAVAPEFRRRGVATALLEATISVAIKNGFLVLSGVAVNGSEDHWRRRGFVVGKFFNYYGVLGYPVVMWLSVGEIPC